MTLHFEETKDLVENGSYFDNQMTLELVDESFDLLPGEVMEKKDSDKHEDFIDRLQRINYLRGVWKTFGREKGKVAAERRDARLIRRQETVAFVTDFFAAEVDEVKNEIE